MAGFPPASIEGVESGGGSLSCGSDGLMAREVELKFLVGGMTGYAAAESKGRELAPLYYDGHRRGSLQCRPVGGGWYQISANYGNPGVIAYEGFGFTATGDVDFVLVGVSVDTTGGTEHVTQAWTDSSDPEAYVGKYPDDTQLTHGAINVSGNQVNGVDITVPALQFTETWLVPAVYLLAGGAAQEPYMKTLRAMTGKVNSEKWRIFEPGDVLFLGARFDVSTPSRMVPVTYSFSARETRKNFYVGNIEVAVKSGWDYMWIDYADAVEDGEYPVKKPEYVYVDRVYERVKFSELQIGDAWRSFLGKDALESFAHPLDPAKAGVE